MIAVTSPLFVGLLAVGIPLVAAAVAAYVTAGSRWDLPTHCPDEVEAP